MREIAICRMARRTKMQGKRFLGSRDIGTMCRESVRKEQGEDGGCSGVVNGNVKEWVVCGIVRLSCAGCRVVFEGGAYDQFSLFSEMLVALAASMARRVMNSSTVGFLGPGKSCCHFTWAWMLPGAHAASQAASMASCIACRISFARLPSLRAMVQMVILARILLRSVMVCSSWIIK